MKQFLDRKFAEWRGSDRRKNIQDFAIYLGVEYGALEHWMSGRRSPKRDNIAKLSEKLGLEVYDIAGYARPGGNGIEPRVYAKFIRGWNDLPPDLQKEVEEIFSTMTPGDFAEFFKELIGRKLLRSGRGSENAAGEPGEQPPAHPSGKGAKRNKAQLLQRKASS